MSTEVLNKKIDNMVAYAVGDRDERSWGSYEVTEIGYEGPDEFCEKVISILPRKALSLQRHHSRSEVWHVMDGRLTVIVNDQLLSIPSGQSVNIPKGAPHCMINLGRKPVLVKEKQVGVCREEDNDRLSDFSGRPTVPVDLDDNVAIESIKLYEEITSLLD